THAAGHSAVDVPVGSVAAELAAAGAASLMTGTESVGPPAGLAYREFGNRPRGRLLSFRTRQRSADQPAVDRTVFLAAFAIVIVVVLVNIRFDNVVAVVDVRGGLHMVLHGRGRDGKRFLDCMFFGRHRGDYGGGFSVDGAIGRRRFVRNAFGTTGGDLRVECGRGLALWPLAWGLRVLVFVLGVAGRAAGLLDVVTNHRDHGVVGEAPLTRTVVVQNVTKP